MKLCFVASSGGHWEELMCLKSIAEKNDSFFVTEESAQVKNMTDLLVYTTSQINRHEKKFVFNFIKLFFFAHRIIKLEKPEVVISTGALIAFPICLVAKLRGAKVVYIESFARVKNGSLTGKLIYRFSDLFLVQWEPLLKVFPKAKYVGCIF